MTTIATDGRSIAADSQVGAECKHGTVSKLHRASDGAVLGCAGYVTDLSVFVDWYETYAKSYINDGRLAPKPDRLDTNFDGLILRPDGTILNVANDGTYFEHTAPAAVGSGCRFAYGAMDAGCDPARAVLIACGRDAFTSEPVEMMWRKGLPVRAL